MLVRPHPPLAATAATTGAAQHQGWLEEVELEVVAPTAAAAVTQRAALAAVAVTSGAAAAAVVVWVVG